VAGQGHEDFGPAEAHEGIEPGGQPVHAPRHALLAE
jgi:hypothetical protein